MPSFTFAEGNTGISVLYFEVIINTIVYKFFIIAGVGLEKFDCTSAGAVKVAAWGRRRRRRRRPAFTFGSEQLQSTLHIEIQFILTVEIYGFNS